MVMEISKDLAQFVIEGETEEASKDAGQRDKVKVLIGGAPVTQRFAGQIGADGYAEGAISYKELVMRLADVPAKNDNFSI